MKAINAILLLTLFSSLTICPTNKYKKLRVSKRSRVTKQEERFYNRDNKKAKVCTPEVINLTAKIVSSLIQGGAIIMGAVLRAVIDNND